MTVTALVWWTILAAFLVVMILAALQLRRAQRELARMNRRVEAYQDLPVMAAVRAAQVDGRKLEASLSLISALVARASAAIAVIRRGPVPPELRAAVRRLRTEIAVFRALARR